MRNGLQDCMVWLEWLTLTKSHGYCWTTYACNSPDFQSCATPGLFFKEEGVSRNNSNCRGVGCGGSPMLIFLFFSFLYYVNLIDLSICIFYVCVVCVCGGGVKIFQSTDLGHSLTSLALHYLHSQIEKKILDIIVD